MRRYAERSRPAVRISGSIVRPRAARMDPLSEVLSLLKPSSYAAGGFGTEGDLAIQWPRHDGIKC